MLVTFTVTTALLLHVLGFEAVKVLTSCLSIRTAQVATL